MSDRRRSRFIALSIAIAAAGLCWGVFLQMRQASSTVIMKADVIETTAPLTLDAARDVCPIALPDTAHDIQFATWTFNQATQAFVRFEAPVADCLEHARQLVGPYTNREGWVFGEAAIAGNPPPLCILDPTEVDLSWFDLSRFTDGVVFTVSGGRAPMVWVDTNQGHFYYEAKSEVCPREPI